MNKKGNEDLKEKQLDMIHQLVLELASGNLKFRITPNGPDESLDSIVSGINMLGEELLVSTVSLEYLNSIYKGIVDMCIVLTPELKIKSVNAAVTNLLQYKEAELLGHPLSILWLYHLYPQGQNKLK